MVSDRKNLRFKTENFRELGLLLFIILLSVLIQFRNPTFLTFSNIETLLINASILSILAVGMMMVLIVRGIDLSIGSTIAFSGMISAMTVASYPHIHPLISILQGTLVGSGVGFLIGLLVAKFKVLPIIATLGMMNVVRGFTFLVSKGRWISAYQMSIPFKEIATGRILGMNTLVVIAVVIYSAFYYFINHTRTGRQIYAVGSNPDAAEVSGIPKIRIIWMVYILMGALAGLAGVLWVSRFASAQGDTAVGYEMNVIAACVLGGISISGGSGKVSGLILGAVLFGILNNALPLINVSPFWQQGIQGVVILSAVLINVMVKRTNERQALRRRII
ncbi:MAG: ABC transporter permease [Sphaerochaetaceae bacterium]|jgi:rhamnose transport system permease protein|nr:ABC transporter permease [Sphaerochaetaceae bacterium]MDD2406861.1 ABC transporter permease [Sphaerochaetaceae bacterium]MDD3671275.1 ABC transporter permease [Sphaerochaetaceae bacterium]MDD4258694.1 ABC transporter permease [Sphaerochaetaceae bacterium]NLO60796.1 ABC transporter permease [Spirochaetales bacterium]